MQHDQQYSRVLINSSPEKVPEKFSMNDYIAGCIAISEHFLLSVSVPNDAGDIAYILS